MLNLMLESDELSGWTYVFILTNFYEFLFIAV